MTDTPSKGTPRRTHQTLAAAGQTAHENTPPSTNQHMVSTNDKERKPTETLFSRLDLISMEFSKELQAM